MSNDSLLKLTAEGDSEMLAVNTHPCFSYSNPKIITSERQYTDVIIPCQAFQGKCVFSLKSGYTGNRLIGRRENKAVRAVLAGVNSIEVSSTASVEEFTFTANSLDQDDKLKITVDVSGKKTQEIYDEVFSKMVDDAQPIPGFRRAKGGKTPNIPKHILLEILGPSKVYEQVIRKVINTSLAQYIAKESLSVNKDLQIEQSYEDLEAGFEPGENFRFDAVVKFQDLN